ncbi:MAG: succinylglutamate desuccinylase/aspartoacylase family protein [Oligoflexia bacterium]|nr:succinylglutamate desuccinylase/aspartoacylase family protein [Oligoflexia bacterium]
MKIKTLAQYISLLFYISLSFSISISLIYAQAQAPSSITPVSSPTPTPTPTPLPKVKSSPSLKDVCVENLKSLPSQHNLEKLNLVCSSVTSIPSCKSNNGEIIFHYDKKGENKRGLKIFAFSLIHGDEPLSGSVTRSWMERLTEIAPRNSWRIIPIANPDGWHANTRANAKGVDLNRNFPSKNWEKEAYNYWAKDMKKDPRRYPGNKAASEAETKCIIEHIKNFKPDFIVTIHTPLGTLDFDGPKLKYPKYKDLPWIRLGNYPGSLGRYMWKDGKIPVLTIELKGENSVKRMGDLDKLQDISSIVAIMANKGSLKNRTTDD